MRCGCGQLSIESHQMCRVRSNSSAGACLSLGLPSPQSPLSLLLLLPQQALLYLLLLPQRRDCRCLVSEQPLLLHVFGRPEYSQLDLVLQRGTTGSGLRSPCHSECRNRHSFGSSLGEGSCQDVSICQKESIGYRLAGQPTPQRRHDRKRVADGDAALVADLVVLEIQLRERLVGLRVKSKALATGG